jgi:hypothetical protein
MNANNEVPIEVEEVLTTPEGPLPDEQSSEVATPIDAVRDAVLNLVFTDTQAFAKWLEENSQEVAPNTREARLSLGILNGAYSSLDIDERNRGRVIFEKEDGIRRVVLIRSMVQIGTKSLDLLGTMQEMEEMGHKCISRDH